MFHTGGEGPNGTLVPTPLLLRHGQPYQKDMSTSA